jgi:orotate phosphoribosyltransferase-like protein
MKHYVLDNKLEVDYPIGIGMNQAIKAAKAMAEKLVEIVNGLDEVKDVNLLCRGSSGSVLSALVSSFIVDKIEGDVIISYVHKEKEQSHEPGTARLYPDDFIVIVDDFTCTGNTLEVLYQALKDYAGVTPNCVCMVQVATCIFNEDYPAPEYLICKKEKPN